jgi:hypothetical protein
MQASCSAHKRNYVSETREAFWDLAEELVRPCSLFDDADALTMKQLALELAFCQRDKVAALQQQFFVSPKASTSDNLQLRATRVVRDLENMCRIEAVGKCSQFWICPSMGLADSIIQSKTHRLQQSTRTTT